MVVVGENCQLISGQLRMQDAILQSKKFKACCQTGQRTLGCKVTEAKSSAVPFHSQCPLIFINYNIKFSLLIVFNDFDTTGYHCCHHHRHRHHHHYCYCHYHDHHHQERSPSFFCSNWASIPCLCLPCLKTFTKSYEETFFLLQARIEQIQTQFSSPEEINHLEQQAVKRQKKRVR